MKLKKNQNSIPVICIFLGLLFQTVAAICTKHGALIMDTFSAKAISQNIFYFFSLVCMVCNAFTWQIVLKRFPLSMVYYINSSLLIIMLLVGYFLFNEKITNGNIFGSILIGIGLIMLIQKKNHSNND